MIKINLINGDTIKAPITYERFIKEIKSPFNLCRGEFISLESPDAKVLLNLKNITSVEEYNAEQN